MAQPDDATEAAARIEKALERIDVLAARSRLAARSAPDTATDAAAVAKRLDALIAKLRTALAGRPG